MHCRVRFNMAMGGGRAATYLGDIPLSGLPFLLSLPPAVLRPSFAVNVNGTEPTSQLRGEGLGTVMVRDNDQPRLCAVDRCLGVCRGTCTSLLMTLCAQDT